MRLAITADTHLTNRDTHPERFAALSDICGQCIDREIRHVILAGDVLDHGTGSIGSLESLLQEFNQLSFHLIPGNHDPDITRSMVTIKNLYVYDYPEVVHLEPGSPPFLFIPYTAGKSMGELINPFGSTLHSEEWYLVSHGDWSGSIHSGSLLEPGVYMPLTRLDTSTYQPVQVFLGHIHKPLSSGIVHYPGSPCGLDITETGRRSFIVFDTADESITRIPVHTEVIFFNEKIVVIPVEQEEATLRTRLKRLITSWNLTGGEHSKTALRIKVSGYTRSRERLADVIHCELEGFTFYKNEVPDLSALYQDTDNELAHLAREAAHSIDEMDWPNSPELPSKDDILFAALAAIYGD